MATVDTHEPENRLNRRHLLEKMGHAGSAGLALYVNTHGASLG